MGKAEALRLALSDALDALLAVTLAPRCAACARPLDAPTAGAVCSTCWNRIHPLVPPLCRTCGEPLPSWRTISISAERCAPCRRRTMAVDRGCAAGAYDGTLREIIHAFKYEGRRSLAAPLGRLLVQSGVEILDGADAVVPVPLHPWRRFRRGFNQAADLAATLDLRVIHALCRVRVTRPQTGLSAAARRRNVRAAFRLSPLLSRATRAALNSATVVLIDDVRTTGATLDGCARVLKDAGVREVRALTVAVRPVRGRT